MRVRLVLENLTVTGIADGLKLAFCRSTNRYSTRAVQLSAKAASRPAPAVQPAWRFPLDRSPERTSAPQQAGLPAFPCLEANSYL